MENRAIVNYDEKNEIIVYQPEGGEFHIEVRLENETVWLTQAQMAELFGKSVSVISRHITNVFEEHELDEKGNLHFLQIANSDKPVKLFSLDVIISVGYRVKSFQGTQFRRWANQVLKEHLLKGGSVNQRLISHENKLENLDSRMVTLEKQVDFFVKANLPPSEGLLNAKSWWSGYEFAAQLVRSAKEEIVIIDPYADDTALALIAKHSPNVKGVVYSAHVTSRLKEEAARLNREFPMVELKSMQNVHDRFIIVDETVYHIGSSLNELGKKLTAFSVLNFVTKPQLLEMVK
ncbi:RhuM family protein [Fibrobacter sp.]|uniref:RhuM family protein n=1 Tax=Fibrobacter sp. TaxID=35828 RepID=UPI00388F9508